MEGEIFGLLGPTGVGKTTTLRMLATLITPSSGYAMVQGYDLLRQSDQVPERIGYVGRAGGAIGSATAREDLVLQARLHGMNKSHAQGRASELIASLWMASLADRCIHSHSLVQRRRLELALGVVHSPSVVFLDEPTIDLDPWSRANLRDDVRRIRAAGTTVLLATSDPDEACMLCDRLAVIDAGRIVMTRVPEELKGQC
jgi:ABC-2 type transport system ATP-binding protein